MRSDAAPPSFGSRSGNLARGRLARWLVVTALVVLVVVQTAARAGEFSGFVVSTRPSQSHQTFVTADGYVVFWNGIPINGDADSSLKLTQFLQDQRSAQGTGLYDARAGYSYLGALVSPVLRSHYRGFLSINAAAWLIAALCMYWLGWRLLGNRLAAWLAGVLTATGQGFSFMVGTPVPTTVGFASVAVILAFAEWAGLFRPHSRLRDWAQTGWLIAAASVFYPIHFVLVAFMWLQGLRRARLVGLLVLTVLALGLANLWPLIGARLVGLGFDPLNSGQLSFVLQDWWSVLQRSPAHIVYRLRFSPIAGTVYGAFPGALLLAAALGYRVVTPSVRRWSLALGIAAIGAAFLFTAKFALPRSAYFAYPAVYLLAAAGLSAVATALYRWRGWPRPPGRRARSLVAATALLIGVAAAVAPSQVALRGDAYYDSIFHYWTAEWAYTGVEQP